MSKIIKVIICECEKFVMPKIDFLYWNTVEAYSKLVFIN